MNIAVCFRKTPEVFGLFHIIVLCITAIANVFLFRILKKKDEDQLLKLLHVLGGAMLLSEVLKQIFCYHYVFDQTVNLWFFPWQLCSMAMYCSFAVTLVKGKLQDTLLVFLSSYSLFSAIVALVLPYDMLRPQILLCLHGFIYHGVMIFEALTAILILRNRKKKPFYPAVGLFLVMALIAEIVNVVAHHLLHDIRREPDMFYITPYYPTTQPIFHDLAVKFGIPLEIFVYLAAITLAARLLYFLGVLHKHE